MINAELESVRDEVLDARDSAVNATVYSDLDARLEAIETAGSTAVTEGDIEDIRDHTYGRSQVSSSIFRRMCPSGWLDFGGIADLATGDGYDDFAGFRTTASLSPASSYPNQIVLWSGWSSGTQYMPIRAMVNGWLIEVHHETIGSPTTALEGHINFDLGAAPSTGKYTNFIFLEVWLEERTTFYRWGATDVTSGPPTYSDPLHTDVVRTIVGMSTSGNWIQCCHRLRIVQDVDPDVDAEGYGSTVYAWGDDQANESHQYTFNWMYKAWVPGWNRADDAGLWRAGNGDSQSKTDLGTYDGYSYSIPMALVHRRNTGEWTISNQNGTKEVGNGTSGYVSSGVSGRPDGLFYDAIDQRDILDLRHKVSISGFNLEAELYRTWQMLTRGELKTQWDKLEYDHDNNNIWDSVNSWGHILQQIDQISSAAEQYTHPVRDRDVTGHPTCAPDGIRTVWSKTPQLVPVQFAFTAGSAGSAIPAAFVTYDTGNEKLTFNAAALDGAPGTRIGTNQVFLVRKSNMDSLGTHQYDVGWITTRGLGTTQAVVTMHGLVPAEDYVGTIYVLYPGGGGLNFPHKRILKTEVWDDGTTLFDDAQFGKAAAAGTANNRTKGPRGIVKSTADNYYVVDTYNQRVLKLDSDLVYVSQFGETGVAGSDNTHLRNPVGVCLAGASEDVIVCDTDNHRVIRLDANLNYVSQFGITGVSGADNTHCDTPRWVAGNATEIDFSDSGNHRLVRLNTSMGYSAQFGTTGSPGSGRFNLNDPRGVALTTSGFGNGIWVADYLNRRIVVLDRTSLTYKYEIGPHQKQNTLAVDRISDVVVDSSGNTYISRAGSYVVTKYNSQLAKVAQFGKEGIPGSSNALLRWPLGMVLDEGNSHLYVCDRDNHRVVRLSTTNLSYLAQYGTTGLANSGPNSCPYPTDVAMDSAGNFYITNQLVHVVTKVLSDFSTRHSRFGAYGVKGGQAGTTTRMSHLNLPMGIAVSPDGQWVVVADAGNARLVRLYGANMTYRIQWEPKYDLTSLKVAASVVYDVEYDGDYPSNPWWVSVKEVPKPDVLTDTKANDNSLLRWAVLRFATSPPRGDIVPNYAARFVAYNWPVGLTYNNTHVITTTQDLGLAYYLKSDPTDYYFTTDPRTNIRYQFNNIYGGLYSDGTRVTVPEPNLNQILLFDAAIGQYVGAAGRYGENGIHYSILFRPHQAILDDEELTISDTYNYRILKRHVSSPWIGDDGIITSMVAPVGSDKILIIYESDGYQGVLEYLRWTGANYGTCSIYKNDVVAESQFLYATTLGLGRPIQWFFQPYRHMRGLTSRLPMPRGFDDWDIRPAGMILGHTGSRVGDVLTSNRSDGPFLAVPVIYSEGLMGGGIDVTTGTAIEYSWSHYLSQQAMQQVVRTRGSSGEARSPRIRGFRSWLPHYNPVWVAGKVTTRVTRFKTSPLGEVNRRTLRFHPSTQQFVKKLRSGVPKVSGIGLTYPIPHFTYFPFLYTFKGSVIMGVIAEGMTNADIAIGQRNSDPANAIDGFFPPGRILIRR